MNYIRTFYVLCFIGSFLFIQSAHAQSIHSFLPLEKPANNYSFDAFTLEREEDILIPFSEKTQFATDLAPAERKIITEGKPGIKRFTKNITYEGISVINSKVIKEEVIVKPVTQVVSVGVKKGYKIHILPDGTQIQYSRSLYVRATSYDHTCKGCNHYTATGRYLTKGIVAVDPKVIKLGTKMYIPGYGYGDAQDTGGAIKGNKIDVAYDDIRYGDWSARWLTIYILD